jgi:hypothetical protein
MTTLMILIAQYGPKETLPFQMVAKDMFGITPTSFLKQLKSGDIDPLGEAPARLKKFGVPLPWIADLIDSRRQLAREAMNSSAKLNLNGARLLTCPPAVTRS